MVVEKIKNKASAFANWLTGMRAKCSASKHANVIVCSVFTISIFLQCILFHKLVYGTFAYSLCDGPSLIIRLSIGLFIASFCFLTKRKFWLIVVSLITAFWSMAELIYYRANSIFIEEYSLTMADNMNGVWDSIWVFNEIQDWLLLLPTLVVGVVVWMYASPTRKMKPFFVTLLLSVALNCWSTHQIHILVACPHDVCEHRWYDIMNPFAKNGDVTYLGFTTEHYMEYVSVLHSFVFQIKDLVMLPFADGQYQMTAEDESQASRFVQTDSIVEKPQPATPLIIVLVESFESWTITPETTPNLCKFIDETSSILYANLMHPQVRHGVSGDGQMIVNTGLLPITDGAACFRFPSNVYPALSHLYQNPGLIAASSLSFWNQKFMSKSYGIKQNYVVEAIDDKITFEKYRSLKKEHDFLMVLTMGTHAPFDNSPEYTYPMVEGMPTKIYDYLNSVKYMDKQLNMLLEDIKNDPAIQSSTVVITADHSGLGLSLRTEFEEFDKERQLPFEEINGCIPFLVYSPLIKEKTIISDPICQMDIYPTLLHLLGCESYYWKGLGVDLMVHKSWKNRPIPLAEAQLLSDKIIRSNYFEGIKK